MFTKELVGRANGIAAGWGNLGGGVTQILIGTLVFPLLSNYAYSGTDEERRSKAWRTACIVPAVIGLATGISVILFSDDSPKGNYSKMKKQGNFTSVSIVGSFRDGWFDMNTWLLFVQYACCFGVEITMNNAAALYFKEAFGMSTSRAALFASIFGWMNVFARGLGGYFSDYGNNKLGMKGRLLWQSMCLMVEGLMVILFAQTKSIVLAVCIMIVFSIFVQAAEGSTYGIVPYVNPKVTGSVSGIVGAGGNVGAVVFSLFFRQLSSKDAFTWMGIVIVSSSFLSLFVHIRSQQAESMLSSTIRELRSIREMKEAEDDTKDKVVLDKNESETDTCSLTSPPTSPRIIE